MSPMGHTPSWFLFRPSRHPPTLGVLPNFKKDRHVHPHVPIPTLHFWLGNSWPLDSCLIVPTPSPSIGAVAVCTHSRMQVVVCIRPCKTLVVLHDVLTLPIRRHQCGPFVHSSYPSSTRSHVCTRMHLPVGKSEFRKKKHAQYWPPRALTLFHAVWWGTWDTTETHCEI